MSAFARTVPWLLGLACAACAASAAWCAAPGEAAERQRIAAERAAAEAEFTRQRTDCAQRFAVTPCIDAARAQRRDALARLRRQESLLEEAERRQRAAQRIAAIREKVSAEESRPPAPARPAAHEPAMRIRAPRQPTPAAAPAAPASVPPAQREADEARSRARYEARQREAQARREAAEARAAKRLNAGKLPAAPLPAGSAP